MSEPTWPCAECGQEMQGDIAALCPSCGRMWCRPCDAVTPDFCNCR